VDDDDEEEETTGAGAEEKAKALIARRLELYPHIAQFRSEGIFLQNVLPKFSLHHPLWPYGAKKVLYLLLKTYAPSLEKTLQLRQNLLGLGEYGFSKDTHLTETSPLGSSEHAVRLLEQAHILKRQRSRTSTL